MSGFFGFFNYAAPGPGVSKNTRQKRGFFVFFEILYRKFWKICQLSLQYTLCAIPYLIAYMGLSAVIMSVSLQKLTDNGLYVLYASVALTLFLVTFFGAGSASAGQALVLRCYSRETHAFIWGDFFDGFKKYLGRSFIIFLIDAAVTAIASFNIIFCFAETQNMMPEVFMLASGILTILIVVLWLLMHPYLYTVMVTHDMPLSDVYKYAFSLALVKLPKNLIVTVISAGIFVLFVYLTLTVGIFFLLFFPLLLFSLCAFIVNFTATRTMDVYFSDNTTQYDHTPVFSDDRQIY